MIRHLAALDLPVRRTAHRAARRPGILLQSGPRAGGRTHRRGHHAGRHSLEGEGRADRIALEMTRWTASLHELNAALGAVLKVRHDHPGTLWAMCMARLDVPDRPVPGLGASFPDGRDHQNLGRGRDPGLGES